MSKLVCELRNWTIEALEVGCPSFKHKLPLRIHVEVQQLCLEAVRSFHEFVGELSDLVQGSVLFGNPGLFLV
jgi:hypothetical protein